MNKKQYAKQIYTALENIDSELLYDARAYHAPKILPYLRYAIAAVIVLCVLSAALILSAENAVRSYITVDTNYGVTLEMNADNTVIKAASIAPLYEKAAESCRKLSVGDAVEQLIAAMGERGGLSENTNTVLFGATSENQEIADALIGSVAAEDSCILRVTITDEAAADKLAKKRRITMGKAALLLSMQEAENGINENRLFRLTANDIALLTQKHGIAAENVTVSGEPLDGGYLTEKQVRQIALKDANISPENIVIELDSDGFQLIYTVLLYEGDKGVAYVISAQTGEIQRVIHAAVTTLRDQLDRVREEFGTISDSTPVSYDDSPTPAPATEAPVDDRTATEIISPTDGERLTPTDQDKTMNNDSATATVAPTESGVTQPSTEASTSPDSYLIAEKWDELPPLDDIQTLQYEYAIGWIEKFDTQPYQGYMIRNTRELQQYIDDYPEKEPQMRDYFIESFADLSLVVVNTEENYTGDYLNSVYFFRRGDTLYVGVFERTSQTRGDLLKTPRNVQQHLYVYQKDIIGVKEIKTVQLTYEDVFGSELEKLYVSPNAPNNTLCTSTWSDNVPEDTFTTRYMVNVNLREFNQTLEETYPMDVNFQNKNRYDHTAALIRSAVELRRYRQVIDKTISDLPYPSNSYMENHAILMTTYIERYSIPSYYITAWKRNGVLYVGFTDESSGGQVRNFISPTHVRVGMIELTKEQVRDVDRIEIVHLTRKEGRTGSAFALADPW